MTEEMPRELTEAEIELVRELASLRDQIALLHETERKTKEALAASMDEYTHGLVREVHVVTISRRLNERFDVARFRNDQPLLARQYTKPAAPVTIVYLRDGARGL